MYHRSPGLVAKGPVLTDGFPVSKSNEVLLSPLSGGCGCIIPYPKGEGHRVHTKGPIWCGMESMSVPNHYFICAECHGK